MPMPTSEETVFDAGNAPTFVMDPDAAISLALAELELLQLQINSWRPEIAEDEYQIVRDLSPLGRRHG